VPIMYIVFNWLFKLRIGIFIDCIYIFQTIFTLASMEYEYLSIEHNKLSRLIILYIILIYIYNLQYLIFFLYQ